MPFILHTVNCGYAYESTVFNLMVAVKKINIFWVLLYSMLVRRPSASFVITSISWMKLLILVCNEYLPFVVASWQSSIKPSGYIFPNYQLPLNQCNSETTHLHLGSQHWHIVVERVPITATKRLCSMCWNSGHFSSKITDQTNKTVSLNLCLECVVSALC
jgi:hypothetical protein